MVEVSWLELVIIIPLASLGTLVVVSWVTAGVIKAARGIVKMVDGHEYEKD